MRITDIKVFPVREDKLKAFVSIILDDCFMVNDIKVIRGKDGYFISMPSRRKRSGKFKDIAHPLNNETRQEMEQEILAAYEAAPAPAEREAAAGDGQDPDRTASEKRPRRRRRRRRGSKRRPPSAAPAGGESQPSGARAAKPPQQGSGAADSGKAEHRGPGEPADAHDRPTPARFAPAATESGRDAKPDPEPARAKEDSRADSDKPDGKTEAQSAEEVAEKHLSDSFWGT